MAGELQAVMVKNPKKARHTCTREYRQLRAEQPQDSVEASEAATPVTIAAAETAMVWEISDGEDEPSDSGLYIRSTWVIEPSHIKTFNPNATIWDIRGALILEVSMAAQHSHLPLRRMMEAPWLLIKKNCFWQIDALNSILNHVLGPKWLSNFVDKFVLDRCPYPWRTDAASTGQHRPAYNSSLCKVKVRNCSLPLSNKMGLRNIA